MLSRDAFKVSLNVSACITLKYVFFFCSQRFTLKGETKTLPFHQTHAVEVDAVKHKKTHVGILKGCFLRGGGARENFEVEVVTKKKKTAECKMRCSHLVDTQGPKRQRFAGLRVDQKDFSIQNHTVATRKGLRDVLFEMSHL